MTATESHSNGENQRNSSVVREAFVDHWHFVLPAIPTQLKQTDTRDNTEETRIKTPTLMEAGCVSNMIAPR